MNGFRRFLETITDNADAIGLIEKSLGEVLRRTLRSGATLPPDVTDIARHVADWIIAAVNNQEPWLDRVNPSGMPLKLAKCHTLDMLVHEADKAMRVALQKSTYAEPKPAEESLVLVLDDGYTLVRLLSTEALKREGGMMQHCIGQGAYDAAVTGSERMYLSLRDRAGNAHVTVEVGGAAVIQMKGKQNRCPKPKYLEMIAAALRELDVSLDKEINIDGLVADVKHRPFSVYALPAGFHADKIFTYRLGDLTVIPAGLKVNGYASLGESGLIEIPDNISTGSDLDIDRIAGLRKIGRGLHVGGNLRIGGCGLLQSLPPDLHVEGGLYTTWTNMFGDASAVDRYCEALVDIPPSIHVGGDLNLSGCKNLTKYPEGLKLHGSLTIEGTRIARLPDDMTIPGNLIVGGGHLETLPRKLHVGGHLWCDLHAFGLLLEAIDKRHDLEIGGFVFVNGQAVSINLIKYPEDLEEHREYTEDGKYYFYNPPKDLPEPAPKYTKLPPFKRHWWA